MKKKSIMVCLFLITYFVFSVEINSPFEDALRNFLNKNSNELVIFSSFDYPGYEGWSGMHILFIYKLSESKGIMIYINGNDISNYFEIFYSKKTNEFYFGEMSGGTGSWMEANDIINMLYKQNFKMITCKNLSEIIFKQTRTDKK